MLPRHPDQLVNKGDTEIRLLAIWKELFQLDNLMVTDSFFDLGGDSISAILCINKIRASFGVEFTLEDFFMTDATISEFALLINQALEDPRGNVR
jgi:yersiniabactin nonribosomal peptide synthetase